MRFISATCLVLGSCLAIPAMAAEAQDWLQRLSAAEQSQSFEGTFIYERNGSLSAHSIWRQVEPSGGVRERLLQLDGVPQEIIRVNGQAQCASSDAGQPVDDQALPSHALNAKQLAQWYEPRVAGESRVAGRSAIVLELVPRDQHRYGVELHVDRETGLPLKSLLVSDKGALLERFQFTQFGTAQINPSAVLQPSANCVPVRITGKSEKKQVQLWRSDWLPPGFNLSAITQRRSPASKDNVDCLIYDDGLTRFSVFFEPLHGAVVADARNQLGPTVAVSRRLTTDDGDVMVTVVGEIPLGTAERVAMSMRADEVHATS